MKLKNDIILRCVRLLLMFLFSLFEMSFGKRLRNLNPYDLHKTLINEYFLTVRSTTSFFKRDTSKDKRDIDVIRENHQFLWEDSEEDVSWGKKLAKKYYDKLFKEYCVSDLSRYKENRIGLRWRTEQEVINGKGQFSCGSKKCSEKDDLRTWEVNFGYVEHGTKKNALVKLRLCSICSYKLNYCHKRKEVKKLKHGHHKIKKDSLPVAKDEKEEKTNEPVINCSTVEVTKESVKSDEKIDNIWKQSSAEEEEETKTREEIFDEYLDQLFL